MLSLHRLGHFAHMCRTYPMQDKNVVKYIDTNEEENHNLNTMSKTTYHPSSSGKRMEHRQPSKASKQQKCTTSTTKAQNTYDHYGYHNLQTPTLPKVSVKSIQVQVATSCCSTKHNNTSAMND